MSELKSSSDDLSGPRHDPRHYVETLTEYLDALRRQVREHGHKAILHQDDAPAMCVGFQSPDGWFLLPLNKFRKSMGLTRSSTGSQIQKALDQLIARIREITLIEERTIYDRLLDDDDF